MQQKQCQIFLVYNNMAINSRISEKIKELVTDDKFLRSKLISILNRADEGKQVAREIKKVMAEIKGE